MYIKMNINMFIISQHILPISTYMRKWWYTFRYDLQLKHRDICTNPQKHVRINTLSLKVMQRNEIVNTLWIRTFNLSIRNPVHYPCIYHMTVLCRDS